jgi:hypothetical protein
MAWGPGVSQPAARRRRAAESRHAVWKAHPVRGWKPYGYYGYGPFRAPGYGSSAYPYFGTGGPGRPQAPLNTPAERRNAALGERDERDTGI